jgi:DNA-binding FrmR family transcriptional regulator
MQVEVSGARVLLKRDPEQKQPMLSRLSRIEGQVRGMRQMIEEDRYCGEIIQQSAAIRAALGEVALLCIQDHLEAATEHIGRANDEGRNTAIADLTNLLRSALKQ